MRWLLAGIVYGALTALTLWAEAALYFDLSFAGLRTIAAAGYGAAVLAVLILVRPRVRGWLICLGGFSLVLMWWLSLAPRNDRNWQPDVARTAWADIEGNVVTIHNVRNFDYRTEADYTPHWESRTIDLSRIRSGDIFLTYWGSPWIAHPIVSYQFEDGSHIAFSIETRKEIGEEYSAVKGFFRQYELIYVVADERDVVRLRTNYRKGEEVYVFRTTHPPARLRLLLLEYLKQMNSLHTQPEWYNALTTNCTTAIFRMAAAATGRDAPPFDWRIILNGRMDEMMYKRGAFAGGLPFPELKLKAHINGAARAADRSLDFSRLIREGRPGF